MFDQILVRPIINILVGIYQLCVFLHIPSPLGFSIVIMTILIRIVLYPLIHSQLKASKKMQELAPHISHLKEKHKGDNARIQQETMRLYKEHGVNPASGCLGALVQMGLVIFGLYPAFREVVGLDPTKAMAVINKTILYSQSIRLTHPWDPTFFGIPLAQNPAHLFSTMPLIVLLPLFTGVLQFLQSKLMFAKPANTTNVIAVKEKNKKAAKATAAKADDFATAFQSQSMFLFPLMIAFFSYQYQIGLSLYWNTFTVFGILQQYHVAEIDGISELKKLWKKNKNK